MFRTPIDINEILNLIKQDFNTLDNKKKEDNKKNGEGYSLQISIEKQFQNISALNMREYFIFFHQYFIGLERDLTLHDEKFSEVVDRYLEEENYYEIDGIVYRRSEITLGQEIPEENIPVHVPDDIRIPIRNRRILNENISICGNIKAYLEAQLINQNYTIEMINNLENRGEFQDVCNQLDLCTRNSGPLQKVGRQMLHRVRQAYKEGEISDTHLPKVTKFVKGSTELINNPTNSATLSAHFKNTQNLIEMNWRTGAGMLLVGLGVVLLVTALVLSAGIIAAPLSAITLSVVIGGSFSGVGFAAVGGYFADRGRERELVVPAEAFNKEAKKLVDPAKRQAIKMFSTSKNNEEKDQSESNKSEEGKKGPLLDQSEDGSEEILDEKERVVKVTKSSGDEQVMSNNKSEDGSEETLDEQPTVVGGEKSPVDKQEEGRKFEIAKEFNIKHSH